MHWWTDFTVWLDNPLRIGPKETVKDAFVGIGVVVIGTISVATLCIIACALADAIRVVLLS